MSSTGATSDVAQEPFETARARLGHTDSLRAAEHTAPARRAGHGRHPVADAQPGDSRSDLDDAPRILMAERTRKGHVGAKIHAAVDVQVGAADSTEADGDARLPWTDRIRLVARPAANRADQKRNAASTLLPACVWLRRRTPRPARAPARRSRSSSGAARRWMQGVRVQPREATRQARVEHDHVRGNRRGHAQTAVHIVGDVDHQTCLAESVGQPARVRFRRTQHGQRRRAGRLAWLCGRRRSGHAVPPA